MKYTSLAKDIGSPLFHPAAYVAGENSLKVKKLLGIPIHFSFFQFRNREGEYIFNEQAFLREEKRTLELLAGKKFFKLIEEKSIDSFNSILKETKKIRNPEKLSNKQLRSLIAKIFDLWAETIIYGHVVNLSDFHFSLLSTKVLKKLEGIKEKGKKFSVGEAFSKLTILKNKTLIQQQEIDFFKLLAFIQKNRKAVSLFKKSTNIIFAELNSFPKIKAKIKAHTKKYDWLEFHYDTGKILDELYFIEQLSNFVRDGVKGKKRLKELNKNFNQALKKRKKLIKELNLSRDDLYWIEVIQSFMYLKALRKEVVFQSSRKTHPLILEASKRLSISPIQLRHATPKEISSALMKGEIDVKELNARIKHCVVVSEKNEIFIYSGKKAKKYSNKIVKQKVNKVDKFSGDTAYPGFVRSTVKIIESTKDISKFKKGEILVSSATNPYLMPAIRIAGAMVTDEGGITCHAAIVARELCIPCVIGTRIATKVLNDGDLVEVYATHGKIKIIKK